jgi:hypothetical protein
MNFKGTAIERQDLSTLTMNSRKYQLEDWGQLGGLKALDGLRGERKIPEFGWIDEARNG